MSSPAPDTQQEVNVAIDRSAFVRLARRPTFTPTDCPNFIRYRDERWYHWYARVIAPLLAVTGGGPMFVGAPIEVLSGDYPFETWMVVRYPTHRRMLAMIVNPYYTFVCNPLRERGTAVLELAFTEPQHADKELARQREVLGLHLAPAEQDPVPELSRLAGARGLRVVYASRSRYDFDFITRPRPVDPSPLTWPVTVALAGPTEELRAFVADPEVSAILRAQKRAAAVRYRRKGTKEMLGLS
ncbi:MAG: DUF1330 domain-containing protein [Candidatus Dadabacteria bacterium]|nr:MAG: DUF1330 domain-containing protein [Candidatus Dadabacteria bacterium]